MSLIFAILVGIVMATVIGFALERSRVFEPDMIVGQMQLRNFIMLKVFLSAVATAAVVLAVNGFGFIKQSPKAAIYGADIVGGVLIGVGIALAGACPSTVLALVLAGVLACWSRSIVGGRGGPKCAATSTAILPAAR